MSQMRIPDTYERFTVIRTAQLVHLHNLLDVGAYKSTGLIEAELHRDEMYWSPQTIRNRLNDLVNSGRAECTTRGYRRLERG
jgi:hypothetical protein